MHASPTYGFTHTAAEPTMSPMEDPRDLQDWIHHRSQEAFTRLVRRHAPMISATCRRELGPTSDADDAAQAVFIICAQRAHTVSPPHQLGAWLFGVAMRVCQSSRRSAARRRRHEREAPPRDEAGSPLGASWEDIRPHLNSALAALKPAHRALIIAHYLEGIPQGTLAVQLGVSTPAAKMRIHYALDKMRTWFAKRGVDMAEGTLLSGLASAHSAANAQFENQCIHAALNPASASLGATSLVSSASGSLLIWGTVLATATSGVIAATLCWTMASGPAPRARSAVPSSASKDPLDQMIAIYLPPSDLPTALSRISQMTPMQSRMLWTIPDGFQHFSYQVASLSKPPYIAFDGAAHSLRYDLDSLAQITHTRWTRFPALAAWSSMTIVFEQPGHASKSLGGPFSIGPQPWSIAQIPQSIAQGGFPRPWVDQDAALAARHGFSPLPYAAAGAQDEATKNAILLALASSNPGVALWATRSAAAMQLSRALPALRQRSDIDALVALGCIGAYDEAVSWSSALPHATGQHATDLIAALAHHPAEEAVAALMQEALTAPDLALRLAAVKAFRGRPGESDLDRFAGALKQESDADLALALAQTLDAGGRIIPHDLALGWLARAQSARIAMIWVRLLTTHPGDALLTDLPAMEADIDPILSVTLKTFDFSSSAPRVIIADEWATRHLWFTSLIPVLPDVGGPDHDHLRAGLSALIQGRQPGSHLALALLATSWQTGAGEELQRLWRSTTDDAQTSWLISAMLASNHAPTRRAAIDFCGEHTADAAALMTLKDCNDPISMQQLLEIAFGNGPIGNRARALTVVKGPFTVESSAGLASLVRTSPSAWIRAMALNQLQGDRWSRNHANSDGTMDADIPPCINPSLAVQEMRSPYSFEQWYGIAAIPQTCEVNQPVDGQIETLCIHLITNGADPRVRHYALSTAWWNHMHADQALIAALSDSDPKVRRHAALILSWRLNDRDHPFPSDLQKTASAALAEAQNGQPQDDMERAQSTSTVILPNGTLRMHSSSDRGTMDIAPEWTPADFGETNPDLYPAPPGGNG